LRNFKDTSSTETADALFQGLDLNAAEGLDSDDESMQDDRQQDGRPKSKLKYMNVLQDIADRKISQLVVELDDLTQVRTLKVLVVMDIIDH